jgi:hypothetical protein
MTSLIWTIAGAVSVLILSSLFAAKKQPVAVAEFENDETALETLSNEVSLELSQYHNYDFSEFHKRASRHFKELGDLIGAKCEEKEFQLLFKTYLQLQEANEEVLKEVVLRKLCCAVVAGVYTKPTVIKNS